MSSLCRFFLYSFAVISITFLMTSLSYDQEKKEHTGKVVDMATGNPESVDVKAWPDSHPSNDGGGCPHYGSSPLYSTISDGKTGDFRIKIDTSNLTYTMTYCSSDFAPRIDTDQLNNENGTFVLPVPVGMIRRGADSAIFESIVKSKTYTFFSDLAYLYRYDPQMYDAAMSKIASELKEVSPNRAELVKSLKMMIGAWDK